MADYFTLPYTGVIDRPDLQVNKTAPFPGCFFLSSRLSLLEFV
jgi:hypothetical protein